MRGPLYEVVIPGASPPALLTEHELLRPDHPHLAHTIRGQYDGALLTSGMVWFWGQWRLFRYVIGTRLRAA